MSFTHGLVFLKLPDMMCRSNSVLACHAWQQNAHVIHCRSKKCTCTTASPASCLHLTDLSSTEYDIRTFINRVLLQIIVCLCRATVLCAVSCAELHTTGTEQLMSSNPRENLCHAQFHPGYPIHRTHTCLYTWHWECYSSCGVLHSPNSCCGPEQAGY